MISSASFRWLTRVQQHASRWQLPSIFILAALVFVGLTLAAPGLAETAAAPAELKPLAGLDGEPWSTSPETMLEVVQELESPGPVVMLHQDTTYRFIADGRVELERHWIYFLRDAAALPDWSTSQMRWSPWFQERPVMRARVIDSAGGVRFVEPESARDRPVRESSGEVMGERRLTEIELPLSVGAVVEEVVVLRDQRPTFFAGSGRHYAALFVPSLGGRLTLEASTRLALRYGVRKMPGAAATTTVEDGRVQVVFDLPYLPTPDAPEDGAPGHRPCFAHVAFSTGLSWQHVANDLASRVNVASNSASLGPLLDAMGGVSTIATLSRSQRTVRALEAVRQNLIFDKVKLGHGPVNLDLESALDAGRGDSLTLATAYVSLLRRLGIRAHVALARAGFSLDVEPQLPGLGMFDHAFVQVEGESAGAASHWVDPSAFHSRFGELPLALQGRFVLVAKPATTELESTPTSQPKDNLALELREVHFADFGPGRIVEKCSYFGSAERTQRSITAGLDEASRRRGYQSYAQAFHLAAALGELAETPPDDLSIPFELSLEALDSNRVRTELDRAVLEVPVRELARRLPPMVMAPGPVRTEEFVFPEPFVSVWRYEVHPPPGFELAGLPAAETLPLGPARFEQRWWREGELLRGELRFDVGQRLLAPGQFEALRQAVSVFVKRPPLIVEFRPRQTAQRDGVAKALAASNGLANLATLRRVALEQPTQASHRVRWAHALLDAGMGTEARHQAQQAVTLAPRWGLAHWVLGETLMHDNLGRAFAIGSDLERAAQALREAVRLSPGEPLIRDSQARLLERNAEGELYGEGAELAAALEVYRRALDDGGTAESHRRYMQLLAARGEWSDLLGAAAEAPPAAQSGAFRDVATLMLGRMKVADLAAGRRRAAAQILVRSRAYAPASQLLEASEPELARLLASAQANDQAALHPQDPRAPLIAALTQAIDVAPGPIFDDQEVDWLHPDLGPPSGPGRQAIYQRLVPELSPTVADDDLPRSVVLDLAVAAVAGGFDGGINGAPHLGYRLIAPKADGEGSSFYVSADDAEVASLRIAGLGHLPSSLGREALRRLKQGDLAGARQWLDWGRTEVERVGASGHTTATDALTDALGFEPFLKLWPRGVEGAKSKNSKNPPSAAYMQLAAATLAAAADHDGVASQVLERDLDQPGLLDHAPPGNDVQGAVDVALLHAYMAAGHFEQLEAHAKLMVERFPESQVAVGMRLRALVALERWQPAEALASHRASLPSDEAMSRRLLSIMALERGNMEEARAHLAQLHQRRVLDVDDAARLLWLSLLDAEAFGDLGASLVAGKSVDPASFESSARWWRALAAWRAERGELRATRDALARAVDLTGGVLLEDAYIVGHMAELASLEDAARGLYARLLASDEISARSPLVAEMTRRRLQGLGD